jgi:hypothetical protein
MRRWPASRTPTRVLSGPRVTLQARSVTIIDAVGDWHYRRMARWAIG